MTAPYASPDCTLSGLPLYFRNTPKANAQKTLVESSPPMAIAVRHPGPYLPINSAPARSAAARKSVHTMIARSLVRAVTVSETVTALT